MVRQPYLPEALIWPTRHTCSSRGGNDTPSQRNNPPIFQIIHASLHASVHILAGKAKSSQANQLVGSRRANPRRPAHSRANARAAGAQQPRMQKHLSYAIASTPYKCRRRAHHAAELQLTASNTTTVPAGRRLAAVSASPEQRCSHRAVSARSLAPHENCRARRAARRPQEISRRARAVARALRVLGALV